MQAQNHRQYNSRQSGFTLIEVMVAVSIFAIIMTVGIGALLSINDAHKKSQTQRAAYDSLNFIVDTLGRDIRTGSRYVQSDTPTGFDLGLVLTPGAATSDFSFRNQDGCDVTYRLVSSGGSRVIERNIRSNPAASDCVTFTNAFETLTNPNVLDITGLYFYARGSSNANNDAQQPMVTFLVTARTQLGAESTDIALQSTVTQRLLDIPSGN
jgi:prepilin-type N-terminal cleavage/methylation domain-containing protein